MSFIMAVCNIGTVAGHDVVMVTVRVAGNESIAEWQKLSPHARIYVWIERYIATYLTNASIQN